MTRKHDRSESPRRDDDAGRDEDNEQHLSKKELNAKREEAAAAAMAAAAAQRKRDGSPSRDKRRRDNDEDRAGDAKGNEGEDNGRGSSKKSRDEDDGGRRSRSPRRDREERDRGRERDRDRDRDRDRERSSRSRHRSPSPRSSSRHAPPPPSYRGSGYRDDRDSRYRDERDRRDRDRDRRSHRRSHSSSRSPRRRSTSRSPRRSSSRRSPSRGGSSSTADVAYRRLRVGNLPAGVGVTKEVLTTFFNSAMRTASFTRSDRCVSDVWLSPDGTFAFVVFSTEGEASAAMLLNNIEMVGQRLQVSRPADYKPRPGDPLAAAAPRVSNFSSVPPVTPVASLITPSLALPIVSAANTTGIAAAGALRTYKDLMQFTRRQRRVHVGNLPTNAGLTATVLGNFFETAIQTLKLNTRPGPTVLEVTLTPGSKFAFLEMRSVQEANNTLGLNGIELQGQPLKLDRPRDFLPLTPEQEQMLVGTGLLGVPGEVVNNSIAPAASGIVVSGSTAASRYVALDNVLAEEDLNDPEEARQVAEDTREKCAKDFGAVLQVAVVTEGEYRRRLLVEFELATSAAAACQGLAGFTFLDEPVKTALLSESDFEGMKGNAPLII